MIIKVFDGYKSKYKGTEVDAAVGRAQKAITLDGDNKFTGSNEFEGSIILGTEATVSTPVSDENIKKVVNIEYIQGQGFVKDITSEMIEDALGYTPYNSANPDGFQANILETVKVNGSALTPSDKTINITVPTSTTQLTNDSGYLTTITSVMVTDSLGYTPENVINKVTVLESESTDSQYPSAKCVYSAIDSQASLIASNTSNIALNTEAISTINSKIPSTASATNQLTDTNFVNSSIATNTAYFIGTFSSVAELEAYSGTLTNNDYAFVTSVDSAGNTLYNRYKYNSSSQEWMFEYSLNNSSFTSEQWSAINSGANITNISQIATNTSSIGSLQTSKQDVIADLETIRAGATAGSTALQPNDNITELVNNAGYLTSITSVMVTDSLGYIPYDSTNPSGYQENALETVKVNGTAQTVTDKTINIIVPTSTTQLTNDSGYITGITSVMVTDSLGYIPYDSTNPNDYQENTLETVQVNGTVQTITDKTVNITVPTSTTQLTNDSGYITGISSTMVTSALGYTPYDSTNPSGYQANVIETVKVNGTALTPSTKTVDITVPTNTTQLVNGSGFITGINSSDVVAALGYTPYDGATNPNNYLTGISYNMVTAALGYTPENSANLTTVIASTSTDATYPSSKAVYDAIQASGGATSLSNLSDVDISSPSTGQNLTYDAVTGKWKNTSTSATVAWGGITGDINDQTDLKTILEAKTTKFSTVNPALTSTSGKCTWDITNTIGSKKVQVSIYDVSTNKEIMGDVSATDSTISIELISENNIAADSYEAIIIG